MAERERRTEFVGLKLSPSERLRLEQACRQAGERNLSRFIRHLLARRMRRDAAPRASAA